MSADSQLMTYLVRMVVPMRREFGVVLDVHQFVHDRAYATEIVTRARGSVDPRLREYAEGIERRLLLGPRTASATAAVATASGSAGTAQPAAAAARALPPDAAPGPSAAPPAVAAASETDLRARMMKKYTTGLR